MILKGLLKQLTGDIKIRYMQRKQMEKLEAGVVKEGKEGKIENG